MDIQVSASHAKSKLPEIGQLWKHTGDGTIYMRIRDEDGQKVMGHAEPSKRFYSVEVGGPTYVPGYVQYTFKDSDNIQLLRQCEPLRLEYV